MEDTLSAVPAPAPTPEQFGMQVRVEAPKQIQLGDTIGLTIHVTWTSAPHPWLLLPQNSPEGSKLTQVSMGMEQTRNIVNGKESPEIIVSYKLVAKDTGEAHIPSLSFDIPVQEGGAMHLLTPPQTVQVKEPFHPMLGFFLSTILLILIFVGIAFAKRKTFKKATLALAERRNQLMRQEFETLSKRVNDADGRTWMNDLEAFMQKNPMPASASEEQRLAYQKLEEAFAQSRYGGGPRNTWELKEWLRTARTALQFNRDDQEENNG